MVRTMTIRGLFRSYGCELLRPWKLITLAAGIGLLVIGSFHYQAPDWDIPVSFIMAGFTYLFSGWTIRVILERRWRDVPWAALATWWCVDGCYALYWSQVNPLALDTMRDANWPASLALYGLCGIIWIWNGSLKSLYEYLLKNAKL